MSSSREARVCLLARADCLVGWVGGDGVLLAEDREDEPRTGGLDEWEDLAEAAFPVLLEPLLNRGVERRLEEAWPLVEDGPFLVGVVSSDSWNNARELRFTLGD